MVPDKNTLGVILGNGRFFSMRNPGMKTFGLPRLLAQLRIEYADGSQVTVVSDTSWKITSKGPIVANNEFDGEEYDARLEMEGWNTNGFDDGAWKNSRCDGRSYGQTDSTAESEYPRTGNIETCCRF